MRRYLIRRALLSALSLLAATIMVFSLAHAKEDPVNMFFKADSYGMTQEQLEYQKKKLGLDRPLIVQYALWVSRIVRGDLGKSLEGNRPVTEIVMQKAGATIQLALTAWIFGIVIGIPLGILSAVKRETIWDYAGRGIALFGQALPAFWVGIVSILVFSVMLGLLPTSTKGEGEPFFTQIRHFILPTFVLGWGPAAVYLRVTRSAMLDVLDSEYITLARAKGVASRKVIWKHAFRNAIIQPITVAALVLAGFLDGAVLVENVFAWPGLGRRSVQAVSQNDFPVLTGIVFIFTAVYLVVNLIVDAMHALMDPRIRYHERD